MAVSLMVCMRYLSSDVCQFDGVHELPQSSDVSLMVCMRYLRVGMSVSLMVCMNYLRVGMSVSLMVCMPSKKDSPICSVTQIQFCKVKNRSLHTLQLSSSLFALSKPQCKRYQDKNFKIMIVCVCVCEITKVYLKIPTNCI